MTVGGDQGWSVAGATYFGAEAFETEEASERRGS